MIENLNENTALKFKTLSPEEKKKRGILGRLYGKVADFSNGTRNGRKYPLTLWEKLFNSDLVKERFQSGGIFGELCHPDYEDVDMQKVAVIMPELPVKDSEGLLVAYLDILDTPCGKIAYLLAKYGYKFGISSRGSGDLVVDENGDETVDPDTYFLNAFDLVEIPAVKAARLTFVESLDTKNTLKEDLKNELDHANESDRLLMEEALNKLNININDYSQEDIPVNNTENEPLLAVDNNEAINDVLSLFQESLQLLLKLLETISSLNELLSVSYTKEMKYLEDIEKYLKAISNLRESAVKAKTLENKVELLLNQVSELKNLLNSEQAKLESSRNKLVESSLVNMKLTKRQELLKESSDRRIQKLTDELERIKLVNEDLINKSNDEKRLLEEKIQTLIKDHTIKENNFKEKSSKLKKIAEKYLNIALKAVDKYIESKSLTLGVSVNEIKNRLSESYTFTEIDKVCDDLRLYKLTVNSLPFSSNSISKQLKESSRVTARPSNNETILPSNKGFEDVDVIDELLLSLAGM